MQFPSKKEWINFPESFFQKKRLEEINQSPSKASRKNKSKVEYHNGRFKVCLSKKVYESAILAKMISVKIGDT